MSWYEAKFNRGCVFMDNSQVTEEGWHVDGCYEDKSFVCQKAQGVCRPGLISFNGRCYEFNVQNRRSWDGAKEYCEAQNMSLLEISNKMEEGLLRSSNHLYNKDVDGIWLGFSGGFRSYRWISGGHVNPSIFVIPEHIDTSNELCGIIYTDGDGNMTVSDNCGHRYPFLCESAADDSTIAYKHPPVDTFCEYDHFQYKGHCYKMVSDNEKSWSDAQKACREDGAKLVSISDSQEQAFLNAHTSVIYWIGLRSSGHSSVWKWEDFGEPVNYRNFMRSSTHRADQSRNCALMMGTPGRNKGQWSAGVCDAKFGYICEKLGTVRKTTPPSRPLVPECVDGFCYELNEEHRVWSEAQDDCRRKGGNLVSIASSYEQTTVQKYVPHRLAGLSLWIGGSDKTSSSAWAWLDGTPFSYMNWDGLTRHSTKLNRCMAMRLESKTWITDECDVKKPYICKRLSDGYDLIGSNCYKFYNESVTQKGATDKCREDNAFLASVSSRLEDINEMQRGYSAIPRWWIGLEDRDNDGEFKWQDGTPVTFVDWAEHQPADVYGITNCVVMTSLKGQWEVTQCDNLADGFICKTSPVLGKPKNVDMSKVCPSMAVTVLIAMLNQRWSKYGSGIGIYQFIITY
ncbi:hypothetical protein EB796_018500 [Bugula neritina]|uniref:C-type lectin domain-containing protein n=1 Tax=Bugula neritina TaxID=10212 RepID=A0A7J7JC33_BUGNE|nr:hypothetical protein EB796_018500 [Bugula neritina]